MAIRRTGWKNVLFTLLGYGANFAEVTPDGIRIGGGASRELSFSAFSGATAESFRKFFSAVRLSAHERPAVEIVGVRKAEADAFVDEATRAWRRHLRREIDRIRPALLAAAADVAKAERPESYPAASILARLLARARQAVGVIPIDFPEGVWADDELQALATIFRLLDDPAGFRERAAEGFIADELERMRAFFDRVEGKPLTEEQRLAVVTDENATLVLAGAGSGKTSVIVAKAAHLVTRGVRRPDEILLMSFASKAAQEMTQRLNGRLHQPVCATTFHALGNMIIRRVEGRGPPLAPEAEDDVRLVGLVKTIIAQLAAADSRFAGLLAAWFGEFFAPYRSLWDFRSMADYRAYLKEHDIRTLGGERVKSFEECQIANWLYTNGIAYEYEPDYEFDVASSERRAYTPDFRLTESGVYIEHFGVRKARGPDGAERLETAPHIDRERYLADMEWKRELHRKHGTTLIETYSYEAFEGRLIAALAVKTAPFAKPKPLPGDQLLARLEEIGRIDPFSKTAATFLKHFKGNGLTIADCRARALTGRERKRDEAFLDIFAPLLERYQERLGDRIDFEDMIIRAARHVESGRFATPYRHVLVDEFQDISAGRARLLKALLAQHADSRLFAVGDDWQAIFRFAGSDVGVMYDFGERFGGVYDGKTGIHRTVDLGRTFRCVDKVALPAMRFVTKNPRQIAKAVKPAGATDGKAIHVVHARGRSGEEKALAAILSRLDEGSRPEPGATPATVLLLGRYHFLKPENLSQFEREFPRLAVNFLSVHAAKGLEADHVVVLGMNEGRGGFPSEIADDPVLALVLPAEEDFPHAEERRLFYVALTRARRSVHLVADPTRPSPFVRELLGDAAYQTTLTEEAPERSGPAWRRGDGRRRQGGRTGS